MGAGRNEVNICNYQLFDVVRVSIQNNPSWVATCYLDNSINNNLMFNSSLSLRIFFHLLCTECSQIFRRIRGTWWKKRKMARSSKSIVFLFHFPLLSWDSTVVSGELPPDVLFVNDWRVLTIEYLVECRRLRIITIVPVSNKREQSISIRCHAWRYEGVYLSQLSIGFEPFQVSFALLRPWGAVSMRKESQVFIYLAWTSRSMNLGIEN